MTGSEILAKMSEGFALHSSVCGFWLMSPIDARCSNVHHGAAKALIRSGRIHRDKGYGYNWQWKAYNPQEGDTVEAARRIGRDLAEKGERMMVTAAIENERFHVKPDGKAGFIAKASELRFLPND